jgi:phosphate uptake regulator
MKRKVIQIADSTQLVSLPRKWAQQHGIKKGDELEVQEQGRKIIVNSGKGIEMERDEVDLSNLGPIVPRVLHALYKKGMDEIRLRFNDPKLMVPVQKMLHEDLIGYEIIKQEKDYCVIKAIATVFEEEFDSMLRRTFLVLDSMTKGMVDALKTGNSDAIKNIRYLETTNNKSTGFCRRVINKKGYKDFKNTTFVYCTVEELEKVADQYKYLCDFLLKKGDNTKNIDKKIVNLNQMVSDLFYGTYELFFKFDIQHLVKLFDTRKKIIEQCNELFEKSGTRDHVLVHYILTITQLIANILSFKMEMEV